MVLVCRHSSIKEASNLSNTRIKRSTYIPQQQESMVQHCILIPADSLRLAKEGFELLLAFLLLVYRRLLLLPRRTC